MTKKTAICTGASSGIGKLAALQLAARGYDVFVAALDDAFLADLKDEDVEIIPVDVTDDAEVKAAVAAVLDRKGRIDVLVNGAAFAHPGAIECVPMDSVKRQFDVNVLGYGRFVQAVLPTMRAQGSGRIVNISSVAGRVGAPGFGWYCATKYAVEGMSEALRNEVKSLGIGVTLIAPGLVATPFLEKQFDLLDQTAHPADYDKVLAAPRLTVAASDGGVPPDVVAAAIVDAVIADEAPIRVVVPANAEPIAKLRYEQGDAAVDNFFQARLLGANT